MAALSRVVAAADAACASRLRWLSAAQRAVPVLPADPANGKLGGGLVWVTLVRATMATAMTRRAKRLERLEREAGAGGEEEDGDACSLFD